MSTGRALRSCFDEVALLYNRIRPRYPEELFSRMIEVTGIKPTSLLLEIGPGTGQATMPLALRGFPIVAVELGASLSKVAKRELSPFSNVSIITGAFEDVEIPMNAFNLIYAATSFHWIDPSVKFKKSHRLLVAHGYLAVIHTNHISDEQGDRFFYESFPIYERYGFVDRKPPFHLPKHDELKPDAFDESLFRLVDFSKFPLRVSYTADGFVGLLKTFSNHRAADEEIQLKFYSEIKNLIDENFAGELVKHYSMSLTILRKL